MQGSPQAQHYQLGPNPHLQQLMLTPRELQITSADEHSWSSLPVWRSRVSQHLQQENPTVVLQVSLKTLQSTAAAPPFPA